MNEQNSKRENKLVSNRDILTKLQMIQHQCIKNNSKSCVLTLNSYHLYCMRSFILHWRLALALTVYVFFHSPNKSR